jgi:hypothetical protein
VNLSDTFRFVSRTSTDRRKGIYSAMRKRQCRRTEKSAVCVLRCEHGPVIAWLTMTIARGAVTHRLLNVTLAATSRMQNDSCTGADADESVRIRRQCLTTGHGPVNPDSTYFA